MTDHKFRIELDGEQWLYFHALASIGRALLDSQLPTANKARIAALAMERRLGPSRKLDVHLALTVQLKQIQTVVAGAKR